MPRMIRYFSETSQETNSVGKLSPKLREALSLKDDMLPYWIYRMRILGYPPGWMQTAESKTLDIFVESSSKSGQSKSILGLEEGEIEENLKYNKDSLIEYPGFNAPVPANVKDDWLILGMPPYQQNQHLSVAAKSMKFLEPVPYKKSRLSINENSNSNSNDNVTTSNSTTLNEEISTKESSDIKENSTGQERDKINQDENQPEDIKQEDIDDSTDCDNPNEESNNCIGSSEKKMKIVSYGTPVPKTLRPNLPSLEKWSVGMGELLNFENLPDATGTYKSKIKGLIDKIRNYHKTN